MEQESDATLWLKVRSGTERAFAVFYNRHRACLFRAALRHTGNTADVEDVVAIVLGEAWRLRERTRIVDGSLLPWLLAVTRNVASNQMRAQRRYERMLARLPSPQFQEDHAEYVDAFLDGQLCRRLLALGTVKSRLHRARQQLRTTLTDLGMPIELVNPSVRDAEGIGVDNRNGNVRKSERAGCGRSLRRPWKRRGAPVYRPVDRSMVASARSRTWVSWVETMMMAPAVVS